MHHSSGDVLMSEMVERVANSIYRELEGAINLDRLTPGWSERVGAVAIKAMREPTEAMTISARKEFGPQTGDSSDPCDVWRNMIAEALK